jgi:HK97 family phage major capsid protein
MLTTIPTSVGAVEFVKMSVPSAAFVAEGADPETADSTVTLDTLPVRTVSAYQVFSKQILEDNEGLQAAVASVINFGLENAIEAGLLTGSGTGANLKGYSVVADTGTIPTGTSKIDSIAWAALKIAENRCLPPNFVVLNPADYWAIRVEKANGMYLLGDPQVADVNIFGMTPIVTPAMPAGYFLVGNSAPVASVIRERKGITAEISTEHSDYFAKSLVVIKAEARLALAVSVPKNFVYAAFPAQS